MTTYILGRHFRDIKIFLHKVTNNFVIFHHITNLF